MVFVGDTHGNHSLLVWWAKRFASKLHQATHIVHVGDFGIGFKKVQADKDNLLFLNTQLKMRNVYLYVIRGNHDDPKWWTDETPLDCYLSNITFVQDYSVLQIEDQTILCVGGAISVDRQERTLGVDYWPDEKFVWEPQKIEGIKPHYVVTHSAPSVFAPYKTPSFVTDYAKTDAMLLAELHQERSLLTQMFQQLDKANLKCWLYGHFHACHIGEVDTYQYRGLDIGEFWSPR